MSKQIGAFQYNLDDLISSIGGENVKIILSFFVGHEKNKDIAFFLKNRAVEFAKKNLAKTFLISGIENGKRRLYGRLIFCFT